MQFRALTRAGTTSDAVIQHHRGCVRHSVKPLSPAVNGRLAEACTSQIGCSKIPWLKGEGAVCAFLSCAQNPTWQKELLRFLAEPDQAPNELLAAVDPESYNEVMARKLIALRPLSRGETELAEKQFEACQRINSSFSDSYWASAYLRRLATDPDWVEWLETR